IAVLRAAAECPDAACTARTLEHSRFGRIDALVLARELTGYRVDGELDAFPEPLAVAIVFRHRQLGRRFWARRAIGDYVVFVRRRPGQGRPVPKLKERKAFLTALATSRSA